MLKRLDLPITESARGLIIPEHLQKDAYVLYRETKDGLIFENLYNSDFADERYADDIVAIPLTSTFLRTTTVNGGINLWNVVGSRGDQYFGPLDPNDVNNKDKWKDSSSWINVWSSLFPDEEVGCYFGDNDRTKHNKIYYGGHMINADPKGKKTEDKKEVFIIPICNAHNNSSVTWPLVVTPSTGRVDVDAIVVKYRV